MNSLTAGGYLSTVPKESTISGCTYRYVRFSGGATGCGSLSGTYAALYWNTEQARPSGSPYTQPACWASMGWGEATAGDPNGNLILLPE